MAPRGASNRPTPGVPQQPFGQKENCRLSRLPRSGLRERPRWTVNSVDRGHVKRVKWAQKQATKVEVEKQQKGDDDTFD